jgi:hypothetical protein
MKSLKMIPLLNQNCLLYTSCIKGKKFQVARSRKPSTSEVPFSRFGNDQLLRLNLFRRETDGGQKSRQLQPE